MAETKNNKKIKNMEIPFLKIGTILIDLLKKYTWQTLLALLIFSLFFNYHLYFGQGKGNLSKATSIVAMSAYSVSDSIFFQSVIPKVREAEKRYLADASYLTQYSEALDDLYRYVEKSNVILGNFERNKVLNENEKKELEKKLIELKDNIFK